MYSSSLLQRSSPTFVFFRWTRGANLLLGQQLQLAMQNGLDRSYQREFALTTELSTEIIHVQRPDHRTAKIVLLDVVGLQRSPEVQFVQSTACCTLYFMLRTFSTPAFG